MDKQLLICVVLCVTLVIELNCVEIDCVPDLLVYFHVGSVGVVLFLEIGCLRCVGDNMVW